MTALRLVMAEDPRARLARGELHAKLHRQRGWESLTARQPRRGVEAALQRLLAGGELADASDAVNIGLYAALRSPEHNALMKVAPEMMGSISVPRNADRLSRDRRRRPPYEP